MHQRFSNINNILIKSLCLGALALSSPGCDAAQPGGTINLPDLAGTNVTAPGHFGLDGQSVRLGYRDRDQVWDARVDGYLYSPALTVDYGQLLTSTLGYGATATRQNGYSEIMVNGVFAPWQNLRMQLSSGQLRAGGDYVAGSASSAIMQNSYLVDLKRYSRSGKMLSDVGISAYSVEASDAGYADLSSLASSDELTEADMLAFGRMDGYALSVGLRPTSRSRIELQRESGYVNYDYGNGDQSREHLVSNRVRYSRYLHDCTRIQGSFSASAYSDRVDVGVARNRWNINLSRAMDGASSDVSVRVGYAIPLGRVGYVPRDCGAHMDNPPGFAPIVDTATARPNRIPKEPLVIR